MPGPYMWAAPRYIFVCSVVCPYETLPGDPCSVPSQPTNGVSSIGASESWLSKLRGILAESVGFWRAKDKFSKLHVQLVAQSDHGTWLITAVSFLKCLWQWGHQWWYPDFWWWVMLKWQKIVVSDGDRRHTKSFKLKLASPKFNHILYLRFLLHIIHAPCTSTVMESPQVPSTPYQSLSSPVYPGQLSPVLTEVNSIPDNSEIATGMSKQVCSFQNWTMLSRYYRY